MSGLKNSQNNGVCGQKIKYFSVTPFASKGFYLALSFAVVPCLVYFVMSGAFFRHITVFTAATFAVTAILVALSLADKRNRRGVAVFSAFILSAFASAAVSYTVNHTSAESLAEYADGSPVKISGYITIDDAKASGNMFVKITHADGKKLKTPVTAQAFNHSGHFLANGAYVEMNAVPTVVQNDEKFGTWLYSKGVHCKIYRYTDLETDYRLDKFSLPSKIKNAVIRSLSSVLEYIPEKKSFVNTSAMAKSLMFGDKSGFSDETLDDFSKSGLTHILCVSGLHFSVMLGGMSALLSLLIKNRRVRGVLLVLTAVVYLSTCGFAKAAVRAGVMALISAFGVSNRNGKSSMHSLLLAVCLICIADPATVFDASFRLSVLSCIGICCSSLVSSEFTRRLENHPIASFAVSVSFMSLSAFSFVFPYSLCTFGGGSTVSVLSSLVAVLPAQICLIAFWCASIASFFGIKIINLLFAGILSALSDYISSAAHFFASLEYSYVSAGIPDFTTEIFFITLVFSAFLTGKPKRAAHLYLAVVAFSSLTATVLLICS